MDWNLQKKHKELPDTANLKQIKVKAVCMLSFGILFFAIGVISCFTRSFYLLIYTIVLGLYAAYALIEAAYYKFWRTIGAFIISSVLFLTILLS